MISQTVKERPVVQTMRNWTKTKAAQKAQVTTVEKTSMTDTDLEQLKVVLNGSQRTLQNVARWCKQKKGIKFGQNITSFIKNKKARRQKLHYSKEEVQQETGKKAPFFFRRAEDLCDIVAQRTSSLKRGGKFREVKMRAKGNQLPPLPPGQMDHFFSPLVFCLCLVLCVVM
jgi:hypothetical protein